MVIRPKSRDLGKKMAVVCKACGVDVSPDVWTGNLWAALARTKKFEKLTSAYYVKSSKGLRVGDIILNPERHVIMVIADGPVVKGQEGLNKMVGAKLKLDGHAGLETKQIGVEALKVGLNKDFDLKLEVDSSYDKKSKALKSAVGDAVAEGDIDRLEDLRGSLADYGMGDYDVDKKIKSEANDMLYDAIDAGNYKEADKYIKIITDGTEFTRDDVVSTITSHYMSDYYEAMDAGDNKNRKHYKSILKKYGMSNQDINIAEGSHYKDYYKSKVYEALERGDTDEAYRIANLYIDRYPYKKENGEVKPNFKNGAEGMIYGLSRTDDAKIREYTTSDKYVNWDIPR